jgi:recombination protein RecR
VPLFVLFFWVPSPQGSRRGSEIKEVVLALNATVDGQTTAHYITGLVREANLKVTRLAYGVPVGGELDYLDEGTLSAAIYARTLL